MSVDQRQPVKNLIITDQGPDSWIGTMVETGAGSVHWHVLPLGFSPERYRHEHAQALNRLPRWDLVDVAAVAGEARSTLRNMVPVLLAEIRKCPVEGTRTIPDLLQGDGFNAWWFLEIVEKSAYRGPFINRLYYLALIRAVLSEKTYQDVRLFLADRLLADAVAPGLEKQSVSAARTRKKPWAPFLDLLNGLARCVKSAAGVALLHCVQVLLVRSLQLTVRAQSPAGGLLVFSFYPGMWAAPYGRSAAEWFFGTLPDFFPREHPVRYAIWLTARPWEIWKRRSELREFFRQRSAVCLPDVAGLGAAAAVLSPFWWWMQIRLALRWRTRFCFGFSGFDIGAIVADEIRRSLSSTELFRDLLICRAWREIMRSVPVSGVLYRLEFQPFESAILYGVGGSGRTIAFMHPLVGENYLPYFFVPGEMKLRNDHGAMPLPDIILTAGDFGREVMVKNGYRPEAVEVCGPVRHRELLSRPRPGQEKQKEARARLGTGSADDVLVIATAVCREEAEGLLAALHMCVEELQPFFVVFKSHPALPLDDMFREVVGAKLEPSRCRVLASVDELYDALTVARAAVLNHSTVVFEALVLDVLPIVFDGSAVFDPKTMESHECGGLPARNSQELKDALRRAVQSTEGTRALKAQLLAQAERWLDRSGQDPYQRFIEILRKHRVLNAGSPRQSDHSPCSKI